MKFVLAVVSIFVSSILIHYLYSSDVSSTIRNNSANTNPCSDWRPDYAPRDRIAALATYLPRVGRSKSEVRGPFPPLTPFSSLTLPRIQNSPIPSAETSAHSSGTPNFLPSTLTPDTTHSYPSTSTSSTSTNPTTMSISHSSFINPVRPSCAMVALVL